MMSRLLQIITSSGEDRNNSLDSFCERATIAELLEECSTLDDYRRNCDNLYQRVRTLFFLYAIHRFHIPRLVSPASAVQIPFDGYQDLLERRFEEAISSFLMALQKQGANAPISSALAARI